MFRYWVAQVGNTWFTFSLITYFSSLSSLPFSTSSSLRECYIFSLDLVLVSVVTCFNDHLYYLDPDINWCSFFLSLCCLISHLYHAQNDLEGAEHWFNSNKRIDCKNLKLVQQLALEEETDLSHIRPSFYCSYKQYLPGSRKF